MRQIGSGTSFYLTLKTRQRLEFICTEVLENKSRVIASLIDCEFFRIKREVKNKLTSEDRQNV